MFCRDCGNEELRERKFEMAPDLQLDLPEFPYAEFDLSR